MRIFIGIPTFLSSALKISNLVTPVPTMPISILYQRLTKKSLPTLFKPPFPTEAGGGGGIPQSQEVYDHSNFTRSV